MWLSESDDDEELVVVSNSWSVARSSPRWENSTWWPDCTLAVHLYTLPISVHHNNWSSTCSSQYASKVRSKNISQFFWWQFSTHLSNNILPKWTTLWFTRNIYIKDFLISKNKNYWFLLTSYLSYSQLLHFFYHLMYWGSA